MGTEPVKRWTSKGPNERKLLPGHLTTEESLCGRQSSKLGPLMSTYHHLLPILPQLLLPCPSVPRRQGPLGASLVRYTVPCFSSLYLPIPLYYGSGPAVVPRVSAWVTETGGWEVVPS